jgi:hypothetical protein
MATVHRYFLYWLHGIFFSKQNHLLFRPGPAPAASLAFVLEFHRYLKESLNYPIVSLWLKKQEKSGVKPDPASDTMKLIKLRLRGLGEIPETSWIEIAPGLNLLQVRSAPRKTALIDALATINPPYPCELVDPFGDLPRQITRQGYTRRVVPHKRTIAIAVFNSAPDLVAELAEISPALYETDLIEVGRRLDYSRWINFIELASSTRWGDIADEADSVLAISAPASDRAERLRRRLDTLTSTDRIKGELMSELADYLKAAATEAPADEKTRLTELRHRVLRARHFATARTIVGQWLPLLAVIDLEDLPFWRFGVLHTAPGVRLPPALSHLVERLRNTLDAADAPAAEELLRRLQLELDRQAPLPALHVQRRQNLPTAGIRAADGSLLSIDGLAPPERLVACCKLIIALSAVLLRSPPILLFSLPNRASLGEDQDLLASRITELADSCQSLCVTTDRHLFPDHDAIFVDDQPRS